MNNSRMIITLGTPLGAWIRLAEHLRQQAPRGIELAEPAFSAWHDRLLGISALSRPDPEAIAMTRFDLDVDPGSRVAAEALCTAQASGDWGGMDMRACWTAGFWAELSPAAEFLVFFESPELTLAHWLAADEKVDPEALLQAWRAGAERILCLVRRHRRRVLLVDAREAAAYPARLLDVCGERLGIAFAGEAESAPDLQTDAAFVALTGSWIRPDKRLRAICAELEVSCTPLTADAPTGDGIAGIPQADPWAALAQYRDVRRQCDTLGREAERLSAALEEEREAAATRMAHAEAERDRLRSQAEAASPDPELRQENELLLLQLHQVQEELEHYFLENQKLEGSAETNQGERQLQTLKVADIQIAGVCEEAPFRHINFSLRNATQGGRWFDALDVRLVEHHGEPGLVVFAAREGVAPLSSWTESGKEQDRAFMLLHPRHKTSKALFVRMTASDWLLINDIVVLMQTALRNAADARPRLAARWGLVCQRLREQLAELPPALRYDSAQVADIVDAAGKLEVTLRLSNAVFRQRVCSSLRVRLCLAGGSGVRAELPGSLVFFAPDERGALPPLSTWPLTDEGGWAQECVLQFGKGLSGAEKKAQWHALDSHDRELVASLLRRLPAALAEGWKMVPPAGLGHANISLLADKMVREIGNGSSRTHDLRAPVLRRVVG